MTTSHSDLEAALRRAHSVLATIINAGLTFDGGVGANFMGEIREAEAQARACLTAERRDEHG